VSEWHLCTDHLKREISFFMVLRICESIIYSILFTLWYTVGLVVCSFHACFLGPVGKSTELRVVFDSKMFQFGASQKRNIIPFGNMFFSRFRRLELRVAGMSKRDRFVSEIKILHMFSIPFHRYFGSFLL
jgi:hypothetical protein